MGVFPSCFFVVFLEGNTMLNIDSINPVFCLSGCGYLHDLVEKDGKVIARIKMLMHYDVANGTHDDIWLDCEVEDKRHLFRLRAFASRLKKGSQVILTFKAEYSSFSAYSGQTPEDPTDIMLFQGRLLLLENCYVNGALANEYLRLAAAA
jgi:hypothetical protein